MSRFEFSGGKRGTIKVNDVDVSSAVVAFRVDSEARTLPLVTLELAVTEVSILADEAAVDVSAGTRELLGLLGWTPPTRDGT